jgi:hypothetical protein
MMLRLPDEEGDERLNVGDDEVFRVRGGVTRTLQAIRQIKARGLAILTRNEQHFLDALSSLGRVEQGFGLFVPLQSPIPYGFQDGAQREALFG